MEFIAFKPIFFFLIFIIPTHLMVDSNDFKIHLKNVSLVKIKAVYRGDFHEKIEVLESNVDDEQYPELLKIEDDLEIDLVSRGMTESLLNNYLIPNCRISVLHQTINLFLINLYKYKNKKQKLEDLESRFNKRNCSKLRRLAYLFKKCGSIEKGIEKLRNKLQELKTKIGQFESLILKCFLAAIKKSWKDENKQNFAFFEEDAKECTYDQLYSIWEHLNLLEKVDVLLKSLIFSSLSEDTSSSSICCCNCKSKKCRKSTFDQLIQTKEKNQVYIKNLEFEFRSCLSYLVLNEAFNDNEEPVSKNKFTSLISLMGNLVE